MASPSKRIHTFSNGTYAVELLTEDLQLYQMGDDFQVLGEARECASIGCPGVMVLIDAPDTEFNLDWQLYVYAINQGMPIGAIVALMGTGKALMNNTGIGNHRKNILQNECMDCDDPRLDKLRTFALNTHAGYDDGIYVYVKTMDGNNPPPMKPGKPRPKTMSEVIRDDYLYLPETHRYLFLDCNNVKWKPDHVLGYGPFDKGLVRPWIGDGRMHSFFPLVSTKSLVQSPLRNWKKLPLGSPFPSPFRS